MMSELIHPGIDRIGGVANGGYAMTCISLDSIREKKGDPTSEWKRILGFVVREKQKDHGMESAVDGHPPLKGHKVVLVEDVITTGGSVMKAIRVCEKAGAEIAAIVPVVDRTEGDAHDFRPYRRLVFPLLTKESFRVM